MCCVVSPPSVYVVLSRKFPKADPHLHLHAHYGDGGCNHPILTHLALSDHLYPLQREVEKYSLLLGTRHPQPRFSRPDHQYISLK